MRPCLVIGASGQVGEHLVRALNNSGRTVLSTYHQIPIEAASYLEISSAESVNQLVLSTKPEIIFVPAALTNVDYCEQNPAESYQVNVTGIKNATEAANLVGARIIYFSTDYIFDGEKGSYTEKDLPNPINHYGQQKLLAEHYVALFAHRFLIIRTTVIFGWERQGKNFVTRLLKTLRAQNPIQVPVDQVGSPTYAPDLARATVELVDSDVAGVFNLAGPEQVSRYELACEVARVFGLSTEPLLPVLTSALSQSAKRPLKAGLISGKAMRILTIPPISYREGLKMMLEKES
jgi:dTDP-4-dehydrorhamnose reductase